MSKIKEIKVKPVGIVQNSVQKEMFGGWGSIVSDIILDKEYAGALDGIGDFSHVVVVYWMSEAKTCSIKHRPQGNSKVPVVGIFSCRCPARPNPIAVTTCRIIKRKGNVLTVEGLDAINNTPVIDIKPYYPPYDKVENSKAPAWIKLLEY